MLVPRTAVRWVSKQSLECTLSGLYQTAMGFLIARADLEYISAIVQYRITPSEAKTLYFVRPVYGIFSVFRSDPLSFN